MFNHIVYLGTPGKDLYLSPQNPLMSAGEAGRHVVDFLYFFIDIFLEVQDKNIVKYCIY